MNNTMTLTEMLTEVNLTLSTLIEIDAIIKDASQETSPEQLDYVLKNIGMFTSFTTKQMKESIEINNEHIDEILANK